MELSFNLHNTKTGVVKWEPAGLQQQAENEQKASYINSYIEVRRPGPKHQDLSQQRTLSIYYGLEGIVSSALSQYTGAKTWEMLPISFLESDRGHSVSRRAVASLAAFFTPSSLLWPRVWTWFLYYPLTQIYLGIRWPRWCDFDFQYLSLAKHDAGVRTESSTIHSSWKQPKDILYMLSKRAWERHQSRVATSRVAWFYNIVTAAAQEKLVQNYESSMATPSEERRIC